MSPGSAQAPVVHRQQEIVVSKNAQRESRFNIMAFEILVNINFIGIVKLQILNRGFRAIENLAGLNYYSVIDMF